MKIKSTISFVLILFFNFIHAQYVMEWESPIGLELKEFADNDSPVKKPSFFDFNDDGNVDIIAEDGNDNFYFYDVLTHELLWSWMFNNSSQTLRYTFVGFTTLTDGGFKEAIFYQNEEDESNHTDDYCLIINTQTNQIFQIELDSAEEIPGLWGGFSMEIAGQTSEYQSNDKLLIQFSDHFEIWGDGTNANSDLNLISDPIINTSYLNDNYPNPFNPSTAISYTLNAPSDVELIVYNTQGEIIEIIHKGYMTLGKHTVNWTPNISSGQYFVQLKVNGNIIETNKTILLK